VKSILSLCFFLALTLLVRCHNFAGTFVGGEIYFVDSDCYSRMTRVRLLMEHPFTIIHHQDFENYPQGVTSHATAPFDYMIALLAVLLKPVTTHYLDLAGAIVSPLIAVAMAVFLWAWLRRLNLPYGGMVLLLFAISPILVHGTVLGRPDHQSLQMLCIAAALGAEWSLSQKPSRGWGIVGGAAWGLALWTSLYEPLVLLLAVLLLYLVFDRRKLFAPERRAGGFALAGILAIAFLFEGFPISAPDSTFLEYFPKWERTIGEMSSVGLFSPLLYGWVGIALLASPVLFFLRRHGDRRAVPFLLILLLSWGLTLWQIRWGYFFALIFAMTIPFQFQVFRKPWIAWCVFGISLWPVLREWDETLFPGERRAAELNEERSDAYYLRDVAIRLKSQQTLPVLAPWWFSPAIAYWSGQPTVAGSSHESLPGIVEASRFFLTSNGKEARKILQDRGVRLVVAYDPVRVLEKASTLLDQPASGASFAEILFRRPRWAPNFLKLDYDNGSFKVFEVRELN
jgi:hypothetical protein